MRPNVSPTPTILRSRRAGNRFDPQSGSVIALVVVFTAVLALVAAGLLSYGLTERRITKRTMLNLEAKNAANAALEYGAAELVERFSADRSFGTSALTSAPIKDLVNRRDTLFATGSGTYDDVVPSSVKLWAGQVTTGTQQYIDPSDPSNDYDPLRGQQVTVQALRLLAEATAQDAAGNTLTSYASSQYEVRDAALFNYAIFYNLTMEFQPGATMVVNGPVMGNKDVYLTASSTLTFLNNFMTAGKFYAEQATAGRPTGRGIYFADGLTDSSGNPETISIDDPYLNGTRIGTYVDSAINTRDNSLSFYNVASQLWRGYVADSSMGVQPANPPGITDPATAHQLIEPPDTSASADATIEQQKFANKAGLYLVVKNGGTVTAFDNATDASAYKAAVAAGTDATWLASNADKVLTLPSGTVDSQRVMWDNRENTWVNTVDVNVGTLRTAIDSTGSTPLSSVITQTTTSGGSPSTTAWNVDSNWNGVMYVDVISPSSGWNTTSDVSGVGTHTGGETAVRLVNGSQLPNRSTVTSGAVDGFTVATNAPIYVVGDYNATYSSSDSSTDPGPNETPASIAADAINVLSNAWWNSSSDTPTGDANNTPSSGAPTASNTEVAAAFLTGVVPTSGSGAGTSGASSTYSGGVENYPRFHENWGGKTLLYRGSIVALFDSEVATGPWSRARYGAPNRNWGFDNLFGSQRRFPPGTPILRTYRRTGFEYLTAADFAAAKSSTMYNYVQMQ